jgi:hypothetical protein
MAPGSGLTEMAMLTEQPKPSVYEMFAGPAVTPETMPPEETVAMPGAELLHEPPDVPSESEVVPPTHMAEETLLIAAGNAFTVNDVVTVAPAVYEMVTTPGLTPTTEPSVPIVATEVLLLVHVPPAVVSPNVVDVPTQAVIMPVMGATCANDRTAVIRKSRVNPAVFIFLIVLL